ncbi:MAG: hypothetical protein JW769_03905 [Parachlamydiales bacterium]|nr:hypothetical protein [Parachlamydiales bacterium]
MKKIILSFIITCSLISSPLFSQNEPTVTKKEGAAAAESSYHAVTISMVVIGVGLAVAIGLLAGLIHSNAAHSTQAH